MAAHHASCAHGRALPAPFGRRSLLAPLSARWVCTRWRRAGSWVPSAGKDGGWRCRSEAQRCRHRCVARRAQASDILSEPPVLPGGEPAAVPPDWRTELSDLAATLRQDAARSRVALAALHALPPGGTKLCSAPQCLTGGSQARREAAQTSCRRMSWGWSAPTW